VNLLQALPGFFAAAFLWTAVGNRAVCRWTRYLSRSEVAAWSFAAGLLIQAAVYSAFLLIRGDPGPKKMAAAALLLLALLAAMARRVEVRRPPVERPRAVSLAMILFAAAGAGIFLVMAISEPMWGRDYLAIWGFKAKTIFLSGTVPERLFHDSATPGSHPEYPLLLPLILASASASAGAWNDHVLAIVYPLFEAGLLLSIFGFVRRRSDSPGAAAACLVVAWFFPLFHPYHVGMAEIPLAFSLVLFSEAVLDFIEGESAGVHLRAALASVLCGGFKPEGALFVILTCGWLAAFSAFRRRPRAGTMILCALGPLAVQAAALRILRGSVSGRDSDWTLFHVARWGELGHLLARSTAYIARAEILPRALPLAALLALFLFTRRQKADFLLFPLATQITLYAVVCAVSTIDPIWQVRTAFARVTAALFPVCALLIGTRLSASSSAAGTAREIG
jgi:hypothetical protein